MAHAPRPHPCPPDRDHRPAGGALRPEQPAPADRPELAADQAGAELRLGAPAPATEPGPPRPNSPGLIVELVEHERLLGQMWLRLRRESDSWEANCCAYRKGLSLPVVKITARITALRRLAEGDARYSLFFPDAPDGIVSASGDNEFEALTTLLHRIDAMLAAIPAGKSAEPRSDIRGTADGTAGAVSK